MTCCLDVSICNILFALSLMQVYMHKCIVVREAGISAYISMCTWPQHYCTTLSALIDDLLVLVPTFVACIAENMEGHAERSPD